MRLDLGQPLIVHSHAISYHVTRIRFSVVLRPCYTQHLACCGSEPYARIRTFVRASAHAETGSSLDIAVVARSIAYRMEGLTIAETLDHASGVPMRVQLVAQCHHEVAYVP